MTDRFAHDPDTPAIEAGQWASLLVQFVENRGGQALVRLPNGSKTRVPHRALRPSMVEYRLVSSDSGPDDIQPGDLYEDCAYHPVLCISRDGDEVAGISLIDGSQPRSCSISHCGVVRIEIAAAVAAASEAKRRHNPDGD